jgi:HK97 family phage major capsid protein
LKKSLKLRQQRAALHTEVTAIYDGAITANRSVTADEQATITAKEAEMASLLTTIEGIERSEQRERELAADPTNRAAVTVHDNAEDAPFRNAGDYLQAVIRSMTPGNVTDPRLQSLRAPTGLNGGVGEQGGFLVSTDIASQIWQRAYTDGQLLSRVNRIPISSGANGIKHPYLKENSRTAGNRFGGVQVYRRAEAATVTATKPALSEFKLELESGMALVYLTDEIMADAAQLDNFVRGIVPKAITFSIEDEIFNGNGVGKCQGILNAPSLVSVTKETGQLAATLQAENLVKMYARMWAPSRANAVWFINQDIEPQLLTMTLGTGATNFPVYMPAGGISGAPYGTIFGKPVIPIEHAATLGTVGDIVLADLSQYVLIEKGGVDVASSIHVQFLYGEQVLRFMYRNNGGPGYSWSSSALTPAKGNNTLSPFVALATRA